MISDDGINIDECLIDRFDVEGSEDGEEDAAKAAGVGWIGVVESSVFSFFVGIIENEDGSWVGKVGLEFFEGRFGDNRVMWSDNIFGEEVPFIDGFGAFRHIVIIIFRFGFWFYIGFRLGVMI